MENKIHLREIEDYYDIIESVVLNIHNTYFDLIEKISFNADVINLAEQHNTVYCSPFAYKFDIKIVLTNGKELKLYDGCNSQLPLGVKMSQDKIIKAISSILAGSRPKKYKGKLERKIEYGYETFYINGVDVFDILRELDGECINLEQIKT